MELNSDIFIVCSILFVIGMAKRDLYLRKQRNGRPKT